MSSKTGKKKSKGSTDWSEWAWDEANAQYYRTRTDSHGKYRYDIRPPAAAAQDTPRSRADADGAGQYASGEAPVNYYENETYGYGTTAAGVNTLSDQFQRTTIAHGGSPPVAYSTSYADPYASSSLTSQGPVSTDYATTAQPIDVPASSARSTSYGDRAYSSSAPARITDYKGKAAATEPGYFPEEATGFIPGAQRAEPSGSGAVTPKTSHKTITGTDGKEEKLDPKFKIHHSKYFKPGHVFKVLWSEPRGETRQEATEVTSYTVAGGKFGEQVHSTIRRFIIVAASRGHCQCLPILTYQRQGATKNGINRDDHAIIYVGARPSAQVSREEGLTREPIEMIPKTHRDKLEAESRINYAKIYTVEHNVKVCFIGHIAPDSQKQFTWDFDDAWNKKRQVGGNENYYTYGP